MMLNFVLNVYPEVFLWALDHVGATTHALSINYIVSEKFVLLTKILKRKKQSNNTKGDFSFFFQNLIIGMNIGKYFVEEG